MTAIAMAGAHANTKTAKASGAPGARGAQPLVRPSIARIALAAAAASLAGAAAMVFTVSVWARLLEALDPLAVVARALPLG